MECMSDLHFIHMPVSILIIWCCHATFSAPTELLEERSLAPLVLAETALEMLELKQGSKELRPGYFQLVDRSVGGE